MNIKIMSRERLEMISHFPITPRTAIISITDSDAPLVKIEHCPEYLLRISFDDIDIPETDVNTGNSIFSKNSSKRKYQLYSVQHAEKIADFYHAIHESTKTLICQCEFGQSRSAAVAAAILEHRSRQGIDIFSDHRYYPNKRVFRMTLNMLNNKMD